MVATAVLNEVQVTAGVMSIDELSKYLPVAVNCGLVRFATVKLAGVTVIDTNGLETVRAAVP